VGMEEFSVKVRREPLGVVGLITPWNYPLLMATVSTLRGLNPRFCILRVGHVASMRRVLRQVIKVFSER
jgi:hypothetical protein